MGYTHYFDLKPRHKRTGVKKLQVEVQKVLDKYKDILKYESDVNKPALCELRDGGREIFIRFNGKDFEHGHETFYFDSQDPDGGYCKTARKDYDEPVTKILLLLKGFYGRAFDLRSDGFSNWQPKDKPLFVGDIPKNKDLDGNWGWAWNWYNDIIPFGSFMRFRVMKVYGDNDRYFRVTAYRS